jgi:organic hydroperoxide reductase OsmC/OhrA
MANSVATTNRKLFQHSDCYLDSLRIRSTRRNGSCRQVLEQEPPFDGLYTFASRFEDGKLTNREELLGAAHAGCFSMALSLGLAKAGFAPQRINTTAIVHLYTEIHGFPRLTSTLKRRFPESTRKSSLSRLSWPTIIALFLSPLRAQKSGFRLGSRERQNNLTIDMGNTWSGRLSASST